MADHTAEARTEAGLTGAAGDTRTAVLVGAVRTGAVAHVIREAVAARISAQVGRAVEAEGTCSAAEEAGVAEDSAEAGRRVLRRWHDREAGAPLAADTPVVVTVAGLRALPADIRRAQMVAGVTVVRGTATTAEMAATAALLTATAAPEEMHGQVTVTVGIAVATPEVTEHRVQPELTPEVMLARGSPAHTGIRPRIQATAATLTVRQLGAATLE